MASLNEDLWRVREFGETNRAVESARGGDRSRREQRRQQLTVAEMNTVGKWGIMGQNESQRQLSSLTN